MRRQDASTSEGNEAAPDLAALDEAILAAHAAGDGRALIDLYGKAGLALEARGDLNRACFCLTTAYVLALEAGDPRAALYHEHLVAQGREQ